MDYTSGLVSGFQSLPVEILQGMSLLLRPEDVRSGIALTSTYLRDVFSDDVYWKLRCKRHYPARWKELKNILGNDSETSDGVEWQKAFLRYDRKFTAFSCDKLSTRTLTPWTPFNQHHHFWSTSCVAFCDSGRLLATGGDSPNVVSVWGTEEPTNSSPLDQSILHNDKVASLKSSGHFLSSASWDKTVSISDLEVGLSLPPLQTLKSNVMIPTHDWQGSRIVTGSEENLCEVFDIRASNSPLQAITVAQATQATQTNGRREGIRMLKPKLLNDGLLLLGYENGVSSIQRFDFRSQSFVQEAKISPSATANENSIYTAIPDIHLDEGKLWYACGRQLLQYDSHSLELIADHSDIVQKEDSLMAINCGNGVLITVTERPDKEDWHSASVVFSVQAHASDRSDKLQKLWERVFPISGQKKVALDFSESACALAVAMDEKTLLLHINQTNGSH